MKQKEFTLALFGSEDRPEFARVTITENDYQSWLKHMEYVDKQKLLCVEILDARCFFLMTPTRIVKKWC